MCCSCSSFVVIPLVMILVNAFLDADNTLTLENFADFFTDKQQSYHPRELAARRRHHHGDMPHHRLSARLHPLQDAERAGAGALLRAADVGELPHPHSRHQGDLHRHGRHSRHGDGHLRHGVQLPALHDPPPAHDALVHRPQLHRGGAGPRRGHLRRCS